MHECLLCKRDMSKEKDTFGNGCINNIYKFLDIKEVVKFKNKEKFLYNNVMNKVGVRSLSKNQKLWLTDRYLAYKYLDSLKYGNFNELKQNVNKDIYNIKNVKSESELKSLDEITLKESYDLYKRENKFTKQLKKLLGIDIQSDTSELKLLLISFSYIFNMYINKKQYQKDSVKAMQYAFWQAVVEVGGKFAGFELSAKLLQHSLTENPKDIVIDEGNIIYEIKKDYDFKEAIDKIIVENQNRQYFSIIEKRVAFNNSDLYFSIHGARLNVKGSKNNDSTWDLEITLIDDYDYTDFKEMKDYYFDTQSILKSLFSSTLYNLAYASVKWGVIKTYEVQIKLEMNNYKVG